METNTKTRRVMLLAVVAWLYSMSISAQVPYPKDMFSDEMATQVKFKGAQPTIRDFVNAYFNSDEAWPEIWGTCLDAWENYKAGKPQVKGSKVLLDTKNGFFRFTQNLKEAYGEDFSDNDEYFIEMCYWNCADKKHKVFAVSLFGKEHDIWTNGQYNGITFHIYDNATHKMYQVPTEDMGIAFDPTNHDYANDVYPTDVYFLPQKGKDIRLETHIGKDMKERLFKWDGMRFK